MDNSNKNASRGNIRPAVKISMSPSIGNDYVYETEGEFLPTGIDRICNRMD